MTPPNTSRLTDQEIEALVRMEKVSAGDFVTVTGAGLNPSEAYTYAKEILKRGGALLAEIVLLRRVVEAAKKAVKKIGHEQRCTPRDDCYSGCDGAVILETALAELEGLEND